MDNDAPKYPIDDATAADLRRRFTGHEITEDQRPRTLALQAEHHALATTVCECAPPSRERSLALTKLEEALVWAMLAIVHEG